MVLLYGDNVRPPDRKAQAIPTHQTTSPKVTVSQEVLAMFVPIGCPFEGDIPSIPVVPKGFGHHRRDWRRQWC
jgi:hypothetical protein